MPSSQYVYADADQKDRKGTMNRRRRSQRIRRKEKEETADPEETILDGDEDKDETILLSEEGENNDSSGGVEDRPSKPSADAMDVDENLFAVNDDDNNNNRRHPPTTPASSAGVPMEIRGGAGGFLSHDPLTSSTMASTPFSAIARKAHGMGTVKNKDRMFKLAEEMNSDDSDDESMTEEEFLRAVAKRQAERQRMLLEQEESQLQQLQQQKQPSESRAQHQEDKEQSNNSFRQNDSSLETQQQQQSVNTNSEETAVMANHKKVASSSSAHDQSESQSFATQPWEKELGSLPNNAQQQQQQNAPQKDNRRQQVHQAHDKGKQPVSNNNGPSHPQNDQQKSDDRQRQEQQHANHQRQEQHTNHHARSNHHRGNQATRNNIANNNPYHHRRQPPPPPTKKATPNVPKISLEHLKSGKKGPKRSNNNGWTADNSRGGNSSNISGANDGDTWQEEAFRSSLLDLLGSFPSNYFDTRSSQDADEMDEHEGDSSSNNLLFATSATESNVDDNSPHSTTSQSRHSAQLERKRSFDAASRSLARLAIASRHSTKRNTGGDSSCRSSGGSSVNDGGLPDFNPPSPRSLPSYMSVMNVCDESTSGGNHSSGYWGAGNASAMLSSSQEVFSGRSVHGRNARTVSLSSEVPQHQGNNSNNEPSSSNNPFSPWTVEELAYGSMILAGQVCHEASCDPNFDGNHSSSSCEAEDSCRVAGFAQSSTSKGNEKRPVVSSALVEASLGFLATAFACLESDFVYAVLKSTLKESSFSTASVVTVFDALSHFAPVSSRVAPSSPQEVSAIPMLSLLTLSRGLEAAIYVARYGTSLDPSSACAAYSSPHYSCGGNSTNCSTLDTGIDESGVGWLSALGRDLGLKLEDGRSSPNSRPRHLHLSDIAAHAFDFILEYNPMIIDDAQESYHGRSGRDGNKKRGNPRGGLYVDTQQIGQGGMDGIVCRQSSVMKDRLYSANVEYLSSMIHAGIVSSWLSSVPTSEGGDMNESNGVRSVERLCQKLFFVIETRARLRRSTNQNTSNDPGDSEAVCAASLSLLILALPRHVNQAVPSSLSTSFRQMGNSTGTIEDLLQSPLVRKMVEMALSWKDASRTKKSDKDSAIMKCQASSNAIYVLSDICMAGGSALISSNFSQRLDGFLQNITESICYREKSRANSDGGFDNSSIEAPLTFLLQLHTGSPILVRQFLRNFIEQNDDDALCFTNGLLHLSACASFSLSSCASSLLRALIDGNPADRIQDRLSEMILTSFDTEHASSSIQGLLHSLAEATYSSVHCNVPTFCLRWHARVCSLGDILAICTPIEILASSLSDEVLSLFVKMVERHCQNNLCLDRQGCSANLSILFLFATFANSGTSFTNDENVASAILAQQRNVKEKLIRSSSLLTVLELAMAQGSSADLTHRALGLQNSVMSLSDERSLAITFAMANNEVTRKDTAIRAKLVKSERELKDLNTKFGKIEADNKALSSSFHEQRFAYERRLELTKSEARMKAKNVSEIHVYERRLAEEQCNEEKELRIAAVRENEQLKRESSDDKARINELEALLAQERKSRQDFQSALEKCKNDLSTTSEELERTTTACHDLKEKLSVSEEQVSDLSANLEDTCAKLIKLATIYQTKEAEMTKYKAELRNAVNTANKHADTAISKYEAARQQNKSLSKQVKEISSELEEIKAHRTDVQRMRKNAPTAYINQMHNQKKDKRRTGKENSFDGK